MKIRWSNAICGGDGSGGISSYLCRSNPYGRVLFNSLLCMDGIDFKGSHPSPPSAIISLGDDGKRCINLYDAWKYPSDLTSEDTWLYFKRVGIDMKLEWDLMIFDMEVVDEESITKIENNLKKWGLSFLKKGGTIIFKTYISRVLLKKGILDLLGPEFTEVSCVQTEISSSYTSEIYVVFHNLMVDKFPPLFPDKVDLREKLSKSFCFSNHASELARAVKINRENLLLGVPTSLLSDLTVDYSTLLTILGVESGYAMSVAKSWGRYRNANHVNYIIGCTILICEANFPTSHTVKDITYVPPNSKVGNILLAVVSLWIWIALKNNSLGLYSQTYEMINDPIKIYFGVERKGKKQELYPFWSLVNKNGTKYKKLRISSKQSIMGQLIRTWKRMFPIEVGTPNAVVIEKFLKFYNRGLRSKRLLSSTGILDFLTYM